MTVWTPAPGKNLLQRLRYLVVVVKGFLKMTLLPRNYFERFDVNTDLGSFTYNLKQTRTRVGRLK